MITANDIRMKMKKFELSRPGYKTDEVDDLLNQVADEVEVLIKEKEDAERKIEVLVENVRHYKADEDALKDAMIAAQKQGRAVLAEAKEKADTIVFEAQQKAEQIISAANVKADEISGFASVKAKREQARLAEIQAAAKDFKSNLLEMYRSHLELITAIPEVDEPVEDEEAVYDSAPDTEDYEESYEQQETPENSSVYDNFEDTKVIDTSGENSIKL